MLDQYLLYSVDASPYFRGAAQLVQRDLNSRSATARRNFQFGAPGPPGESPESNVDCVRSYRRSSSNLEVHNQPKSDDQNRTTHTLVSVCDIERNLVIRYPLVRKVTNQMTRMRSAEFPPILLCLCARNAIEFLTSHGWILVKLCFDRIPNRLEIITKLLLGRIISKNKCSTKVCFPFGEYRACVIVRYFEKDT